MTQNRDLDTELTPYVRNLQIVIPALSLGALIFLVIALVIQTTGGGNAPQDGLPILTLVAFFMAVSCLAAHFIVPNIIATNALRQRKQTDIAAPSRSRDEFDVRQFAQVYVSKTIIAAALLEGASFMAITAYLLEGNLLCVALALLLIIGIATHFPTTSKVATWIEEKRRLFEEERHLAR